MRRKTFQPRRSKKEEKRLEILTNAAWLFARAALWPDVDMAPEENESVLLQIGGYFHLQQDLPKAFTNFCERIIIANRYAAAQHCKVQLNPSAWFSKDFTGGFYATQRLHEHLQANQNEIPRLWLGMCALAYYYWRYVERVPYVHTIRSCRRTLLDLKEYELLHLLYTVTFYLKFFNPMPIL